MIPDRDSIQIPNAHIDHNHHHHHHHHDRKLRHQVGPYRGCKWSVFAHELEYLQVFSFAGQLVVFELVAQLL